MDDSFRIGDFTVDPSLNRIRRGDRKVQIESKAMEVLAYLSEHPNEVLPKDRIIQAVWPDVSVTDDVLTHAISELRKAFKDDPRSPKIIQTIPRKGYRLVAHVSGIKQREPAPQYQILKELGRGGMGEVYLARDNRLDRKVAVKALPDSLQDDETARKRFKREAKLLATLNHPNIAAIYDLEKINGKWYLILELVDGPGLGDVIEKGPLELAEALRIALQITEALETAHEAGIIHRDLKPGNIKITPDGTVKLLDFGLAKGIGPQVSPDSSQAAGQVEETTIAGLVTGTAAYMSPEQARGGPVDRRTDIWAFGVLLFEMLSGTRLFAQSNTSETLACVLKEDPPWPELPSTLPPVLRRVIERCLEKDSRRRVQAIGEARIAIDDYLADPEAFAAQAKISPAETATGWRRALPWVLLPLLLAAVWLGWTLKPGESTDAAPEVRFTVPLPEGKRLTTYYRHGVALSPDGEHLAFVAGTTDYYWQLPSGQIYLRTLDQWQTRPVDGTQRGLNPVFSPDGAWIAFIDAASKHLRKVAVEGGEAITLCQCPAPFGMSWADGANLVFARMSGPLLQVPASGGDPVPITSLDEAEREISHRLPYVVMGGQAILFTVMSETSADLQIHVLNPKTGESRKLLQDGSDARFVPTGHLVFARSGNLMAVAFDLESLEIRGAPVQILEGVNHSIYTGNTLRETAAAQFSFSHTGIFAYARGSVFPENENSIVWVDRQGREELLPIELAKYRSVRLSPDGRQILLNDSYPPEDVLLYDLERSTTSRQSFEGNTIFAIWGPGPEQFTFDSDREGTRALFVKNLDSGPGPVQKLPTDTHPLQGQPFVVGPLPSSWRSDGKRLAYTVLRPETDDDIWMITPEGKAEAYLETRFQERYPEFSPDGRWLAYTSNESGKEEVYVRPYPGPGRPLQISTEGGTEPAWSRDGKEIVYRTPGMYFAVRFTGSPPSPGRPLELFGGDYGQGSPIRGFDIGIDGRLLLVKYNQSSYDAMRDEFFPTEVHLVQNWFEELKRLVPTDQ